jgi:hypothetical protein
MHAGRGRASPAAGPGSGARTRIVGSRLLDGATGALRTVTRGRDLTEPGSTCAVKSTASPTDTTLVMDGGQAVENRRKGAGTHNELPAHGGFC